jgi:predicted secreted Zn-dependent protease
MSMKVYLPKSDCWVRNRGLDDYALDHEQRHFDIAKIVAAHFKQKIIAINLPPDNYDGEINVEYLETLRELHRMQMQYDKETRHGSNRHSQEQWGEKIDRELKALGIKK